MKKKPSMANPTVHDHTGNYQMSTMATGQENPFKVFVLLINRVALYLVFPYGCGRTGWRAGMLRWMRVAGPSPTPPQSNTITTDTQGHHTIFFTMIPAHLQVAMQYCKMWRVGQGLDRENWQNSLFLGSDSPFRAAKEGGEWQ